MVSESTHILYHGYNMICLATWALWGFKREKSGKKKSPMWAFEEQEWGYRFNIHHGYHGNLIKIWCWPSQKLWANCDSQLGLGLLISKKQLRNTCQNSIHTIQNWNMDEYAVMTGKSQRWCIANMYHVCFRIHPIYNLLLAFLQSCSILTKKCQRNQLVQKSSSSWKKGLGDPIGFSRSVSSSWNPEFNKRPSHWKKGAKKQCH